MSDKRKVSTDALETLGTIIDSTAKRDAIHVGVEPVEAGEKLYTGQDIALIEDKAYASTAILQSKGIKPVGIVDPFLKEPAVFPGQWFWLIVYPRTITSLRHVWEHPDFPASIPKELPEYIPSIKEIRSASDQKEASHKWLLNFAAGYSFSYAEIMAAAEDTLKSSKNGNYHHYLTGGAELEGEYVPDEFWYHYGIVTGQEIDKDFSGNFFTCSC